MKRMCHTNREFSRPATSALLCHARIVTDPKKLARLYAEAARQKRSPDAGSKLTRQKHISSSWVQLGK
jgi:hypothetical protein